MDIVEIAEKKGFSWLLAIIAIFVLYKVFDAFMEDYKEVKKKTNILESMKVKIEVIGDSMAEVLGDIKRLSDNNKEKDHVLEQIKQRQEEILKIQELLIKIIKGEKKDDI